VTETTQEAEPLGSVITVVANIVLGEPAVDRQELSRANGPTSKLAYSLNDWLFVLPCMK
jgi:hypothetical protein